MIVIVLLRKHPLVGNVGKGKSAFLNMPEAIARIDREKHFIYSIAWSSDWRLALGGLFGIYIHDPFSGECLKKMTCHNTHPFEALSWSPDSSRLVCLEYSVTHIWNTGPGDSFERSERMYHETRLPRTYCVGHHWPSEGKTNDHVEKSWQVETNSGTQTLFRYATKARPSPDGKFCAVRNENAVEISDMNTDQVRTFEGHEERVNSISWSPDSSRLASASDDNTVRVWDVLSGECIHVLNMEAGPMVETAWSPDGEYLAIAEAYTARVWRIGATPAQKEAFQKATARISDRDVCELVNRQFFQ